MAWVKPYLLADSFKSRFVVGQVFVLVPVMAAIVVLFFVAQSPHRWVALVVHILLICFCAWVVSLRADRARREIERYASEDLELARVICCGGIRSEWWPLFGAVIMCGIGFSVARHDWRWAIVVFGIGGLMAAGLFIRWILYDRWLRAELT